MINYHCIKIFTLFVKNNLTCLTTFEKFTSIDPARMNSGFAYINPCRIDPANGLYMHESLLINPCRLIAGEGFLFDMVRAAVTNPHSRLLLGYKK
jgi:hypothetical protein